MSKFVNMTLMLPSVSNEKSAKSKLIFSCSVLSSIISLSIDGLKLSFMSYSNFSNLFLIEL